MNTTTTTRRGRLLAGLVATSALAVGGLAATGAPAQSADPAGDCTAAYPVADLTQGQEVTGSTVVSGVTPTGFTGEVLGVLDSGIAPVSTCSSSGWTCRSSRAAAASGRA